MPDLSRMRRDYGAGPLSEEQLALRAAPHVLELTFRLDGDNVRFTATLDGASICEWSGPVAQLDTNPLTTFTQLVLTEEKKQAEDAPKNSGQPGADNIVANTCTK